MADISNQLEGATEGLDRFIDSLDEISIRLGSNAALEAKLARAKKKEVRIDARTTKQKVLQLKNLTDTNKLFKEFGKNIKSMSTEMMKGGMSKGMSMIKGAMKAGAIGGLVIAIKVIIDGMLKIDKSMAVLVKATGQARTGLEGMMNEVVKTESAMGTLGVNLMVATKEAANLSQQFGTLDKVTTNVIQTSLKLQMAYGVSAEAAGQLLVTMDRIGKSTEDFVSNMAVKAVKAGVNVSLVMRDITSHAQQYAMYNERAQQAMENMAIQSARTGGSLDDIKNISAAYASVEGIAENVGRVGTFFGKEAAAALGDPRNAYMMAEMGMWDELQKNHDKAFKNDFKLQEASNGLLTVSNNLSREKQKIMEATTGESVLVLQNRRLENALLEKQGPLLKKDAKLLGVMMESEAERLESAKLIMDIQKKMIAKGQLKTFKKLSDLTEKDRKNIAKQVKLREEEARKAAQMNQIIKESQTIVERFKNIFAGIWGEFTTQMSVAFGLDDRGEDSAMGKMEAFAEEIKKTLNLGSLAEDIAEGGGGLTGFVGAMATRLEPLFVLIKDKLIEALQSGMEWFSNNVDVSVWSAILPWGDDFIETTGGKAQEKLAEMLEASSVANLQTLQKATPSEKRAGQKTRTGQRNLSEALGDLGFEEGAQQEWAMAELAAMDEKLTAAEKVKKLNISGFKQLQADAQWELERQQNNIVITEGMDLAQKEAVGVERKALATRLKDGKTELQYLTELAALAEETRTLNIQRIQRDKRDKEVEAEWDRIEVEDLAIIALEKGELTKKELEALEVRKAALDASLDAYAQVLAEPYKDLSSTIPGTEGKAPLATGAKGLSGYRGTALVGERGGEVVISRSALRNGIGVGGRAASALAGIGVPGFYRGEMIEGSASRQGLAGAAGAQSFRAASASAFQAEQKNQQRAMVEYWRREFNRQMDEASKGAKEERKKDSIEWQKHVKGFFNAYPALIDRTLQKAFNVQDGVGKEMYTGVFTAMQSWSEGESPKKALTAGVQIGLAESLKEGGTLDNFFKKQNGILSDSLASGLAMFAATGDLKKSGKMMAKAGAGALMEKYLGADAMMMAGDYRSGGMGGGTGALGGWGGMGGGGGLSGIVGGYLQGQERGARGQGFGNPAGLPRFADGVVAAPVVAAPAVAAPTVAPTPAGSEAGVDPNAGVITVEDMEGAAATAADAGMLGAGGAGGAGGGGADEAIIQILSAILQTNTGIAPQIISGNSTAIAAMHEGLMVGQDILMEMIGVFHQETSQVLNGIGTLLGEIGTDLSGRMGKQIGHLSKIDTKVASHPSELQHKMKLTQGAGQGASDAIPDIGPPAPTGLSPAKPMALVGGMKGANDAWNGLEGGGFGGLGFAATGKYVNRPTLMMVGERNRGEVVIPTDRIRKGLPINAGVASELGSIGVPGFQTGGAPLPSSQQRRASYRQQNNLGAGGVQSYASQISAQGTVPSVASITGGPAKVGGMSGYLRGEAGSTFKGAGGLSALGKGAGAGALMAGFDTFMQTGDWKQGVTAGVGAAAGIGISAGLMAVGVPPPLNTMIGGFAGQMIGKGLNKVFGITGGQKKARKRAVNILEKHIKSGSIFDFGQPSGVKKQMKIAIGGKENAPTEGNYNKLVERIGNNKVFKPLYGAGFEPEMIVAMGQGKLKGKQAFDAYAAANTALYGHAAGDKYMQAMQVGPQLAEGGVVTRPTTALIGERGPEVVIPLTEQRKKDKEMIDEMKKQNKLMMEMIKTQKETGKTEIRLDGRKISETVGDNFYDIGSGQ